MTGRKRIVIPYDDLNMHYEAGWAYVMPNFDKPNHYVVEWLSDNPPVYPNRVPETNRQESANADDRRQQPVDFPG
jgi:hypothetical protein